MKNTKRDKSISKRDKVDRLFSRPAFKPLIPLANSIMTLVFRKKLVFTEYDNSSGKYLLKEKGKVIHIDVLPAWNKSFDSLKSHVLRVFCKFYIPRKGDVVIDLGAGIGSESIIFSNLVSDSGRVYAIEAQPDTAETLSMLIRLSDLKNVELHKVAIGDKRGDVYIDNNFSHNANAVSKEATQIGNRLRIPMTTLDEFVKENNITQIDFIKINIEGAEEYMIEGMHESIKLISNIVVSCHDFLEDNPSGRIKKKIIEYLAGNGFKVYDSHNPHHVLDGYVYASKQIHP